MNLSLELVGKGGNYIMKYLDFVEDNLFSS